MNLNYTNLTSGNFEHFPNKGKPNVSYQTDASITTRSVDVLLLVYLTNRFPSQPRLSILKYSVREHY